MKRVRVLDCAATTWSESCQAYVRWEGEPDDDTAIFSEIETGEPVLH